MKFFKRLLCKHSYSESKHYFYDFGMSKFFVKTCKKCGKEKVNTL